MIKRFRDLLDKQVKSTVREASEAVMAARQRSRERWNTLVEYYGGCVQDAVRHIQAKRRQYVARTKALRIGLKYWPALISNNERAKEDRVDPRAFLEAEKVLKTKFGYYGRDPETQKWSYGGWDMQGSKGLCPNDVRNMWLASGCKPGDKFRAQLITGIVAGKGESAKFVYNLARGRRWLSNNNLDDSRRDDAPSYSRKAAAALGRLSPEIRHAATRGLLEKMRRNTRVRIRDLNWAEVKRIQNLRSIPTRKALLMRAIVLSPRAAAVALGMDYRHGTTHPIGAESVRELCPSYPKVSRNVAAQIVSGVSPVEISQGHLTRKEAHQWLQSGEPSAISEVVSSVCRFLVADTPIETMGQIPRDPTVARWVKHIHERGSWSALVQEVHHAGRRLRRLDVLDEIAAEDLDRGISTGVVRAFENAGRRISKLGEGDHRVITYNPFPRLPRGAKILTTSAMLINEGKEMKHCVGGYARSVEDQQCHIMAMVSKHGRSTVELRKSNKWWVAQHFGPKNSEPHRRHRQLVSSWLNRYGG